MTAVLYIIMRNDLMSMNSGKAIAQGSHASNAFVRHIYEFERDLNSRPKSTIHESNILRGFKEWENSTSQGFGTVLTLEAKMSDIEDTVSIFKSLKYVADVIHDPTYPILDGEVVHHVPLNTCAYVFVPSKEDDEFASTLLKRFPLHR